MCDYLLVISVCIIIIINDTVRAMSHFVVGFYCTSLAPQPRQMYCNELHNMAKSDIGIDILTTGRVGCKRTAYMKNLKLIYTMSKLS